MMIVEFEQPQEFIVEFGCGSGGGGGDHPSYDGRYEVTPTSAEQILRTENKVMQRDVTVHKTPYSETSNIAGGYTASIL